MDTYDLSRFTEAVLDPLRRDGARTVVLRAFDRLADQPVLVDPVAVPPECVVIVERMFLHRDELFTRWDLSIFLEVPFEESVRRMAARDGTHPDPDENSDPC